MMRSLLVIASVLFVLGVAHAQTSAQPEPEPTGQPEPEPENQECQMTVPCEYKAKLEKKLDEAIEERQEQMQEAIREGLAQQVKENFKELKKELRKVARANICTQEEFEDFNNTVWRQCEKVITPDVEKLEEKGLSDDEIQERKKANNLQQTRDHCTAVKITIKRRLKGNMKAGETLCGKLPSKVDSFKERDAAKRPTGGPAPAAPTGGPPQPGR